jgi:hypothetical protein
MTKQMKRKKCSTLLLKIYIQKALETFSRDFLTAILVHLGFRTKWVDLIACLLHTTDTRVLINGNLTNHIDHRRGLRHGNPLSLLHFVISMNTLVAIIDVVVFLEPSATDLAATMKLFDIFALATSL